MMGGQAEGEVSVSFYKMLMTLASWLGISVLQHRQNNNRSTVPPLKTEAQAWKQQKFWKIQRQIPFSFSYIK